MPAIPRPVSARRHCIKGVRYLHANDKSGRALESPGNGQDFCTGGSAVSVTAELKADLPYSSVRRCNSSKPAVSSDGFIAERSRNPWMGSAPHEIRWSGLETPLPCAGRDANRRLYRAASCDAEACARRSGCARIAHRSCMRRIAQRSFARPAICASVDCSELALARCWRYSRSPPLAR